MGKRLFLCIAFLFKKWPSKCNFFPPSFLVKRKTSCIFNHAIKDDKTTRKKFVMQVDDLLSSVKRKASGKRMHLLMKWKKDDDDDYLLWDTWPTNRYRERKRKVTVCSMFSQSTRLNALIEKKKIDKWLDDRMLTIWLAFSIEHNKETELDWFCNGTLRIN